jgi:hypothetical protein
MHLSFVDLCDFDSNCVAAIYPEQMIITLLFIKTPILCSKLAKSPKTVKKRQKLLKIAENRQK